MMSCTHNHKHKMNDDEQKYSDKSIVRNCKRRTYAVVLFLGWVKHNINAIENYELSLAV